MARGGLFNMYRHKTKEWKCNKIQDAGHRGVQNLLLGCIHFKFKIFLWTQTILLAQENYTMVCGQKGITFLKDFTKFCACLTPQSIFVLLPSKIYLDLLAIFLKATSQLSSNGQICKDNDHSGQPACTIKSNQIRSVHHRPLFSLSTSHVAWHTCTGSAHRIGSSAAPT